MSIATGKNAITTISRIFGARSKPNQRMKIGASATLFYALALFIPIINLLGQLSIN